MRAAELPHKIWWATVHGQTTSGRIGA